MRKHLEGIQRFLDTGLTNARLEGINNKIRRLSHRADGFIRRCFDWNEARAGIWRLQAPEDRHLAILDADGTIAETGGRCKEGIGLSYDGRWGYHPLVVSLANSQKVLYVAQRSASRPSQEGKKT